jgi:hypothetical protein
MKKIQIIFILGVWIVFLPYLGFPYFLKNILFSITGLIIIYFSYFIYINLKKREKKEKSFDNFSENSDFNEKV